MLSFAVAIPVSVMFRSVWVDPYTGILGRPAACAVGAPLMAKLVIYSCIATAMVVLSGAMVFSPNAKVKVK
jgi:hypothetical protein